MAFLLSGLITMAQQAAIEVRDAKTQEPVAFAHVCFEGIVTKTQKHFITDIKGKVPNECKEVSVIAISYVGFETLIDTVYPHKNILINLKPAVLNINEVVVTAQFTPERADRSIYRVNVINSRQIEQKAANNLTDLLAGESNMRISQGGVLGSSLSMQGLSGENVKFLIDGIPVIGRMNGNIDLNQMNLFNVDHVEIIEGPMSVVYGSNAIAGVVNIITKENKNALLTSSVNAYVESIGVYNFDAGISKKIKKHTFYVDAARNFFQGFSDNDTARNLKWKPRRQYNTDAYYLFTGGKLRIKTSALYFNELLLDKGPLLLPYYESAFDNHFTTVRYTGRIESTYSPRRDRQWSMSAAYAAYSRIKNRYLKDLTTLEQTLTPNADDQDTTDFNNILLRAWFNQNNVDKFLNYQAGIDINVESGSGKRIKDLTQEIGDYAAFLSMKIDPVASLSLQPGARFIYNSQYKAPLVYSMNIKWNPAQNWVCRLTYARGFKAPALKELYLYFVDINHNVQGNPDLKSEYSHNVNLNIGYSAESKSGFFNAEAGIFYNNIDNNIALASVNNDLYTYINIGKFVSRGGQAGITWNSYPALSVRIGASVSGQKFAFDKASIINAMEYWSNDITSNVSYKFGKSGTTATLFYKFSGRAPQVSPRDNETIGAFWVEKYNMLDVSVIKSFLKNTLSISAGAKNIFDVTTLPATGSGGSAHSGSGDSVNIAWGRTWFLKLAYNFNKYK
jgi:outer membrane receptor for ferrienterochelin and colicins